MPRTRTTTKLLLEARRAADLERDVLFVTDDEASRHLNTGLQALYDKLVAAYGDDYFVATPYQFVTNGTSEQYPLPSDFYKLLGRHQLVPEDFKQR